VSLAKSPTIAKTCEPLAVVVTAIDGDDDEVVLKLVAPVCVEFAPVRTMTPITPPSSASPDSVAVTTIPDWTEGHGAYQNSTSDVLDA
jgi:hypothetical protein